MTDDAYKLIAIGLYMVLMLLIGFYAYRKTSNLTDYMLGGRSLGPAVTALSAGAADMSGWLLMGLPGGLYLNGLADAWIAIGLTIGAYLNWVLIAPRLRSYTQVANDSITIPSYLENRFKDSTKLLRIVSSLVILIFFTFYVSSGMVSGAVFFESSFGLHYKTGLFIVAGVVVAYTLFGGFLAVSWTDFIQGLIMVIALLLVPAIAIFKTGGPAETFETIRSIDPTLLNLFKGTTVLGVISALAWGLGYVGQPHIIVRFMAIKTVKETKSARRIGMGWMILSLAGTSLTALIGIAYFHNIGAPLGKADAETVFIQLGQILFHPLIAGLVLAAVLAAIMSTVSSQLIVTSSALTEDLYKLMFRRNASDKELVFFGRMAVLVVAIVAALLAFDHNSTILKLVSYAWAGFGASFGPVVFLSLFWKKMNNWGAIFGMVTGAATVIIWSNLGLSDTLYEIVPGFIVNLIVSIVVSLATYKHNGEIEKEFEQSKLLLKQE
ncbi:sodium/proline symporter PutP [Heyndrickxia oleronia]|uniref:Sodium/proline symporter n=1 Tax=Heyndrickxia oleronia TaxID=38875 RepID=A0A8E2LEA0_9BACI|nr:sodium/proline symporter PutP [Heyndrickxia oleronia]NYV67430.1 sodium/proline symporter PutP [Bacillus sp. Gen3]OJH16633.1 sodium/proline symporter [Bacillus obstructivus]MBU5213839.1 sodium/proline symporter PutP [Heyndrickxia oleronia]MEC1374967.1 sodium/proline symporter PutP [Heyndrickxia oleronia]OOP67522.1 sodium/proline symporter [Heyndrickxia oleronia]